MEGLGKSKSNSNFDELLFCVRLKSRIGVTSETCQKNNKILLAKNSFVIIFLFVYVSDFRVYMVWDPELFLLWFKIVHSQPSYYNFILLNNFVTAA